MPSRVKGYGLKGPVSVRKEARFCISGTELQRWSISTGEEPLGFLACVDFTGELSCLQDLSA